MGMPPSFSKCSYSNPAPLPRAPNPDPRNFKIIRASTIGNHMVVLVNYPDCINFKGNKILLFKNTKDKDIFGSGILDPHFCESGHIKPFARFEPTEVGWVSAIELCKILK